MMVLATGIIMAFVIRHGTQTVGVAYSAIVQRPMVAQGLLVKLCSLD